MDGGGLEEVEAVGQELETVVAGRNELDLVPEVEATLDSQFWASMLSWKSWPVQIRMPIAIRIRPPVATIAW